jgi:hypothetical protein
MGRRVVSPASDDLKHCSVHRSGRNRFLRLRCAAHRRAASSGLCQRRHSYGCGPAVLVQISSPRPYFQPISRAAKSPRSVIRRMRPWRQAVRSAVRHWSQRRAALTCNSRRDPEGADFAATTASLDCSLQQRPIGVLSSCADCANSGVPALKSLSPYPAAAMNRVEAELQGFCRHLRQRARRYSNRTPTRRRRRCAIRCRRLERTSSGRRAHSKSRGRPLKQRPPNSLQ